MKREDLKEIGLTGEQVESVMKLKGNTVEEKDKQIEILKTERDNFKTQLNDADKTINSYKNMDVEGIKKSAAAWEEKYKIDTQELQKKLTKQTYENVVKEKIAGFKFTSQSAKKSFISDLMNKELKLENENILGLDDFVKEYKEIDPKAFENEKSLPTFSGPTPGIQNKISGDPDKMDYNTYKEWRKQNN